MLRKRLWRRKLFEDRIAYLLILPYYIIFIYFMLIPICEVIVNSFTNFNLFEQRSFIGFANYEKLLGDEIFLISIKNTVVYVIFTIAPSLTLGLLIALLLNLKGYRSKLARTFVFLPYVVSMVSVSMVWMLLYDPTNGLFNKLLRLIGMPPKTWLMDPDLALPSIIIMGVWKAIGYSMIIYLAALQGISKDYYEASEIDGANRWKQFRYVTFPLLAPATFFLLITGLITSFNVFDQVNIMTSGGPVNSTTVIVHQIYQRGFWEFNMGYASAQSVVLLLGVLIITAFNWRFSGSGSRADQG